MISSDRFVATRSFMHKVIFSQLKDSTSFIVSWWESKNRRDGSISCFSGIWSLDRIYFGGGISRKALFFCLAVVALSAFTINSFSSVSHYQTSIFPIFASWYFRHTHTHIYIYIYIYIYILRFLLTFQYHIKTIITTTTSK